MSNTEENNKNWFLALLLSIVCLDRLYLGQIRSGIVKFIFFIIVFFLTIWFTTFVIPSAKDKIFMNLFSIWYLYDIVRIVVYRKKLYRAILAGKVR